MVGNLVHTPAELSATTDWDGLADSDPDLARRARQALGRLASSAGLHLVGPHFPDLMPVHLEGREHPFRWRSDVCCRLSRV